MYHHAKLYVWEERLSFPAILLPPPLLPHLPFRTPIQQWIDKIRTPRASNEARQRIFSKMSGELPRKMGQKALEAGGNAVIG